MTAEFRVVLPSLENVRRRILFETAHTSTGNPVLPCERWVSDNGARLRIEE